MNGTPHPSKLPTFDFGPEAGPGPYRDEGIAPSAACATTALPDRQPLGRWIERSTVSLRPHPNYLELWGPIAPSRVSRVSQHSGPIVEPLVTTADGTILDGHARWQVANERQQQSLPCLVYDVSREQALEIVIQRHRSAGGLNAYARILLALRLEPYFRKSIASSETTRGAITSSNLTKRATRDVRQDIARAAGVSTGNVTKVKQVVDGAIPEIRERLLSGDVSIHRAWQWRTLSKKAQSDALWSHLNRRGIKTTIRQLVKRHTNSSPPADPIELAPEILASLAACDPTDLTVAIVDVPGRAVVVTRAFYEDLRRRTDAAR